MSTIMTDANVNQLVNANSKLVIDFWAPWCGPCKRFLPIFDAASAPGILFVKVDITANPTLVAHFGIKSVPTLVIVKDKQVVTKSTGGMSAQELNSFVSKNV